LTKPNSFRSIASADSIKIGKPLRDARETREITPKFTRISFFRLFRGQNVFETLNYYNYFTEIEDTFVRRRGKNLLLSPLDWALMEGWQERGVPLHVVLRAIETVFDGYDKNPQPRTIKSLFYCREEIEAQYKEWTDSQVGKTSENGAESVQETHSREAVLEFLQHAVEKLRGSKNERLKEDFERACARLRELEQNLPEDLGLVEPTLYDIESFIDRSLVTNADPEHLKNLKKETAAQLKMYKSAMEAETYQNTFDLMLLKRLREEEDVPRLSLFYL